MSDLLALAARCEAAEGPDRELDALIRCACHLPHESNLRPAHRHYRVVAEYEDGQHATLNSPAYTASLDAALTLVPEGHLQPSEIVYEAIRSLGKRFDLHMMHWPLLTPYSEYLARHVCAAALKARAAQ